MGDRRTNCGNGDDDDDDEPHSRHGKSTRCFGAHGTSFSSSARETFFCQLPFKILISLGWSFGITFGIKHAAAVTLHRYGMVDSKRGQSKEKTGTISRSVKWNLVPDPERTLARRRRKKIALNLINAYFALIAYVRLVLGRRGVEAREKQMRNE